MLIHGYPIKADRADARPVVPIRAHHSCPLASTPVAQV